MKKTTIELTDIVRERLRTIQKDLKERRGRMFSPNDVVEMFIDAYERKYLGREK